MAGASSSDSGRACHPGEYLLDELDERGWSPRHLARVCGLDTPDVKEILAGTRRVDESAAAAFSRGLGTSQELWLNLQARYDTANAAAS